MLSAGSEREAKAGARGGQLERAHQAAGGGERQAQVRGLLPQVGHHSWLFAHLDYLRMSHSQMLGKFEYGLPANSDAL